MESLNLSLLPLLDDDKKKKKSCTWRTIYLFVLHYLLQAFLPFIWTTNNNIMDRQWEKNIIGIETSQCFS